jgi:hypothetical protein
MFKADSNKYVLDQEGKYVPATDYAVSLEDVQKGDKGIGFKFEPRYNDTVGRIKCNMTDGNYEALSITITGKITMDCTEAEFKQSVMKKVYDFEAHSKYMDESYYHKGCNDQRKLYYFLSKQTFGFGFEPFELDHELMKMITDAGIKYVEE